MLRKRWSLLTFPSVPAAAFIHHVLRRSTGYNSADQNHVSVRYNIVLTHAAMAQQGHVAGPLAVLLTNSTFFNISVALELTMTFYLTDNNTF